MEGLSSVILPAATLSLTYIATYVRLIRNNMIRNQKENYVLYARVRGLKESTIIKHIFKNSLQASLTALGMSVPKLLAGTVIVENIFAWPGIGRLCVTAIFNRDYPIIQAYVLFMAVLFVVCNLLVDIFSAVLDPRLRQEK
jgi:nickel transport system permease protein